MSYQIVSFIIIFISLFYFLIIFFKIQIKKINRNFLNSIFDDLSESLAHLIQKLIIKDSYFLKNLKLKLLQLNIEQDASYFLAILLAKSIWIFLLFSIFAFINLIFMILALVLAIIYPVMEIEKLDKQLQVKMDNIEDKILDFNLYILNACETSKDLIDIIEKYKDKTNKCFKLELERLLIEARLQNIESAISTMDLKLNSTWISKMSKGLLMISRGEDYQLYFNLLNNELKAFYQNKLKLQAMKLPSKLRFYSTLMMISFLILLLYVSLADIFNKVQVLFR